MQERYVKVRLLDAPLFLDREYDYRVPEELSGQLRAGCFVTVPFGGGNRRRMGLVMRETERDPSLKTTKPIRSVSQPRISLSEEMLGLVCFLREQTLCSTGDAVHAMIPAGALAGLTERYIRTDKAAGDARRLSPTEAFMLAHLDKVRECGADSLKTHFGADTEACLLHLCRLGLVRRELAEKAAMAARETVIFSLAAEPSVAEALLDGSVRSPRLGEKQRAVLELLLKGEQTADALRERGCGKQQTDALLAHGLISCRAERNYRNPYAVGEAVASPTALVLNEEQQVAFDEICRLCADGEPHGVLLHGVTGSG